MPCFPPHFMIPHWPLPTTGKAPHRLHFSASQTHTVSPVIRSPVGCTVCYQLKGFGVAMITKYIQYQSLAHHNNLLCLVFGLLSLVMAEWSTLPIRFWLRPNDKLSERLCPRTVQFPMSNHHWRNIVIRLQLLLQWMSVLDPLALLGWSLKQNVFSVRDM